MGTSLHHFNKQEVCVMKKSILIVLVLLLLLTACQTAPADDDQTLSSTPSSSGTVTPPSSSVPATSIPATSVPDKYTPATNPNYTGGDLEEMKGFAFIFDGRQPTIRFEVDISKLIEGHLYYIDLDTREITLICDETVLISTEDDFNVDFEYYVKASEPTKIYRTNLKNPAVHTMVYESTFGPVNDITIHDYTITEQKILQFVADNKYFVVLDLETGETALVMEQYYLRSAAFEYGIHKTWDEHNYVFFSGKLSEGEKIKQYLYSRDTGTTELEEDTWSDG
jgi:hypothetical protein